MSAKYSEAGGVLQINYLRVIFHFWSVHTFGCIKTVKLCGKFTARLRSKKNLEKKVEEFEESLQYNEDDMSDIERDNRKLENDVSEL